MLIPGYRISDISTCSSYFPSQEAEPRDRRARLAWPCQEGAHLRRKVTQDISNEKKLWLWMTLVVFVKKFSERTQ